MRAAAGLVLSFVSACGSTPIAPVGPLPGDCGPSTISFTVGSLGTTEISEAIVSEGVVYLHRRGTGFSNAPGDLELYSFEPLTARERQLTANDLEDRLLDAGDGALLFQRVRTAPGGTQSDLVYRDEAREVVLDTWAGFQGMQDGTRRLRAVRRDRAAWLRNDTVFYYDGLSVRSVSEGLRFNSPPYLDGNIVVWVGAHGDRRDLHAAVLGETLRLTADGANHAAPVTSGSRIFWLADGKAAMRELRGGETRVLDAGPCVALDTHGGMAVFACGDRADNHEYPFPARRLVWFDGTAVRRVPTGGGIVQGPRIRDGRIAWVEHASPSDLCGWVANTPRGTLHYWTGDERIAPAEVARLGAPCLCCDAYWPPVWIDLERDLLTWNYALGDDSPQTRVDAGYALVHEQRLCAR
jgi:hypothetical protein